MADTSEEDRVVPSVVLWPARAALHAWWLEKEHLRVARRRAYVGIIVALLGGAAALGMAFPSVAASLAASA